jgi:hypothetical protein
MPHFKYPLAGPAHVRAATPILTMAAIVALVIGAGAIIGGILLVYLGSQGTTAITFFGNSFKSQNVGIAGIFLGAVLVAVFLRRLLLAVERLARM